MPSLLILSAEQVSENISAAMANYPQIFAYITCFIRYALVALALLVVVGCGISLLRGKHDRELWGYVSMPDGTRQAIEHWENVIGRSNAAILC